MVRVVVVVGMGSRCLSLCGGGDGRCTHQNGHEAVCDGLELALVLQAPRPVPQGLEVPGVCVGVCAGGGGVRRWEVGRQGGSDGREVHSKAHTYTRTHVWRGSCVLSACVGAWRRLRLTGCCRWPRPWPRTSPCRAWRRARCRCSWTGPAAVCVCVCVWACVCVRMCACVYVCARGDGLSKTNLGKEWQEGVKHHGQSGHRMEG
jgi:hypothetical protein